MAANALRASKVPNEGNADRRFVGAAMESPPSSRCIGSDDRAELRLTAIVVIVGLRGEPAPVCGGGPSPFGTARGMTCVGCGFMIALVTAIPLSDNNPPAGSPDGSTGRPMRSSRFSAAETAFPAVGRKPLGARGADS